MSSDRIPCSVIHEMEIWHSMPMTFPSVAVQAAKIHMPPTSDPAMPHQRVCQLELRNMGTRARQESLLPKALPRHKLHPMGGGSLNYDILGIMQFSPNLIEHWKQR